ncbi:AraC family transcriptional regulator [Herbaspirillum sp. YR522]|uniref:helix-turn-helix transcriptional regulator n=1 Tax=Herbaspirillum sp. YR522 TaxID=1144342 RepID=UPI00026FA257|nr:AraC family transcriptional regulator [Herbaspirillum sp. YR522]EJN07852.1 DNA-binding domain-containing protein, AraC-type [Herbaspirillum sp. YR522]
MIDPLSSVVALLQPKMAHSKIVTGAGRWGVRGELDDAPLCCCVVLDGKMRYTIDGTPLLVEAGDFLLIPSMARFSATSFEPPDDAQWQSAPAVLENGEHRNGLLGVDADVRTLVGFCHLGSPDSALLLTLLPSLVHIRGDQRLSSLVQLVIDESRAHRAAREVVLERLLEVMLIEALRSSSNAVRSPGLLRALADSRLAHAIRRIHERPQEPWTVALMAKESALSRSAFFERFSAALGVTPMQYLLSWRMALASNRLARGQAIAEVAAQVGYSSASTFTVAFTRHAGMPPGQYSRSRQAVADGKPTAPLATA